MSRKNLWFFLYKLEIVQSRNWLSRKNNNNPMSRKNRMSRKNEQKLINNKKTNNQTVEKLWVFLYKVEIVQSKKQKNLLLEVGTIDLEGRGPRGKVKIDLGFSTTP
ncbi:hypothetical protein Dimus_020435 [Dionaea muscipula]